MREGYETHNQNILSYYNIKRISAFNVLHKYRGFFLSLVNKSYQKYVELREAAKKKIPPLVAGPLRGEEGGKSHKRISLKLNLNNGLGLI